MCDSDFFDKAYNEIMQAVYELNRQGIRVAPPTYIEITIGKTMTKNNELRSMFDEFKKEHPRGFEEIKEVLEEDQGLREKINKMVIQPLNQ